MPAKTDFYTEIGKNKFKSVLLLIVVFAVLVLLAYTIGQVYDPTMSGFFIFIGAAIAITQILVAYYAGDKISLSTVGAKPAEGRAYLHLNNVVEGLCLAAGLPKPQVYVMESNDINAFATGRDPEHSSICVTTGALDKLNRQELEGVVAHELSHVYNYDIRFTMLAAVAVGMVAIVSNIFLRSFFYGGRGNNDDKKNGIALIIGILLAVLAPISAKLVQLAISRNREYLADATGVKLTRYPAGLAGALEKIKKDNTMSIKTSDAMAPLFIAPIKKSFVSLFATHPPIEKRIEILNNM